MVGALYLPSIGDITLRQFDLMRMETVHFDLSLKVCNERNRPSINSVVIVYVSDNYTVKGSLTTSPIMWCNLVHYFSAAQSKL